MICLFGRSALATASNVILALNSFSKSGADALIASVLGPANVRTRRLTPFALAALTAAGGIAAAAGAAPPAGAVVAAGAAAPAGAVAAAAGLVGSAAAGFGASVGFAGAAV